MKRKEAVKKKVRSDKKVDVKPTVPSHLFGCITDLSYVVDKPMKDVVEFVCNEGIESKLVIGHLSQHFRSDFQLGSTLYIGDKNLTHKRYIIRKEKFQQRISTRFQRDFFDEKILMLAHSLGYTPSSATGVLLETSVKDISIIDKIVKTYTSEISDHKKKVLKDVIKYVRKDNPFMKAIGFVDIVEYFVEWLKDN
jgi:hypothetical protein